MPSRSHSKYEPAPTNEAGAAQDDELDEEQGLLVAEAQRGLPRSDWQADGSEPQGVCLCLCVSLCMNAQQHVVVGLVAVCHAVCLAQPCVRV